LANDDGRNGACRVSTKLLLGLRSVHGSTTVPPPTSND